MRVWVTGSRGYLGSRIVGFLKHRYPKAIIRGDAPAGARAPRLQSIDTLQKKMASFRPTHVVHAAGLSRPASWKRLEDAHVGTTFRLLEAARRLPSPRPRILLLGSAAEYGEGVRGGRFSEKDPCRPQTEYGVSKHLQTQLVLSYHALGVPVIMARLFNLFAPDAPATFAVSRVWGLLQRVKPGGAARLETGPLDAVRDYVTVKDALTALGTLLLRGRPGEVYNVCSGRGLRMGDLFNDLAKAANVSVSWVTGGAGSGKSAASRAVGNPTKTARHTGWRARQSVRVAAQKLTRSGKGR